MKNSNGKKFAFMLGRITPTKESEALNHLSKLDFVDDARLTFGKFDFIAKIHFEDFESFFESYLKVKHIPDIKPQKILIAKAFSRKQSEQTDCETRRKLYSQK